MGRVVRKIKAYFDLNEISRRSHACYTDTIAALRTALAAKEERVAALDVQLKMAEDLSESREFNRKLALKNWQEAEARAERLQRQNGLLKTAADMNINAVAALKARAEQAEAEAKANSRDAEAVHDLMAENCTLQAVVEAAQAWVDVYVSGYVGGIESDKAFLRTVQALDAAKAARPQEPGRRGGPQMTGWRTMENAPRDGTPILAWCEHGADPYVEDEEGGRLTPYGAWCGWMGHSGDGPRVLVWGGGYKDSDGEQMPDWWFVDDDGDFETPANPVLWRPIEPPGEEDPR